MTGEISSTQPGRVVVAMSGGVDSSVAAALLVDAGYDVVGLMMRLWSEPEPPVVESQTARLSPANRCCTPDQMADARRVADRLGIPFYVLDVQTHFRQTIVQFFIDEHLAGRTPNPCIECNRQIRFTYLLEQALALGASHLATGHYAQIRHTAEGYRLLKGRHEAKDQSYVLHVLGQHQLAHTLFPVGAYTKDEVRGLARHFGLPVAAKQESQDLCFLSDGDYRRFLRQHDARTAQPGPIVDQNGRGLGRHEGLSFYTIGQRKGLGLAAGEPLFVLRKDAARNTLIVGPREALQCFALVAHGVNWIRGRAPHGPIEAEVKIRYKAAALPALVTPLGPNRAAVALAEPVYGVTAGQGAVFYDGDECLGGGLICESEAHAVPVISNTEAVAL